VSIKSSCNFLLVINSNYGRIHCCFRDIDAFSSKIARFPPHSCLTPPGGGTPCDINVIYTTLKSAFNKVQFRRSQYASVAICLAAIGTKSSEIPREFEHIAGQGRPRSSHAHTVVWGCCKDDRQSQWGMAIFDPQPTLNPWTDRHQIWNTWLGRVQISPKIRGQSAQGFLPPHVRNRPKPSNVYCTFSVLPSPHRRARWTDFRD